MQTPVVTACIQNGPLHFHYIGCQTLFLPGVYMST